MASDIALVGAEGKDYVLVSLNAVVGQASRLSAFACTKSGTGETRCPAQFIGATIQIDLRYRWLVLTCTHV